jgi:hypothetical protein
MNESRLAYLIDLLFLLLAPLHPALIMLAVVQYVVRRSAWLCGGLLALFGQDEVTALALVLLPGAVVYLPDTEGPVNSYVAPGTGSAGDQTGASTGSVQTVPPQQRQLEPALVPSFEAVIEYLKQHNLTDEQAIDMLALMRRDAGDLLSANKIRDVVGGNEAAVKARVAAWRSTPQPQRTQGRVPRPHGGW